MSGLKSMLKTTPNNLQNGIMWYLTKNKLLDAYQFSFINKSSH